MTSEDDVEPWVFGADDLDALAVGARMRGSGGAGDTYAMQLLTREVLDRCGGVPVFPLGKIAFTDRVVAAGLVGSILAFGEKPGASEVFTQAFTDVANRFPEGRTFVCAYEMAGLNAFVPLLIAGALGIGVADVDGMGRALPGLHQTTFNAHGVPMSPFALADTSGRSVEVARTTAEESERSLRLLLEVFGGWAAFAGYAMTAADARRAGIPGSLKETVELGYSFLDSTSESAAVGGGIAAFCARTPGALHIGAGRVVDVRWSPPRTGSATARAQGTIVIRLYGTNARHIRIEAQSEFLVLIDEGSVVAAVPDIICLLDSHRGSSLLTESILPGYSVDVVVLQPPKGWDSATAAGLVDPASFGYDLPTPGAADRRGEA